MTKQRTDDQRTLQQRALSVFTDLGFNAAEMRSLSDRLAAACARRDMNDVCDLAEALENSHREHAELYTKLLVIPLSHQQGRRLPAIQNDAPASPCP